MSNALLLKAVRSLSVCPSVTLVIHAYTVQGVEINFTPYDRTMLMVFNAEFHVLEFRGSPEQMC